MTNLKIQQGIETRSQLMAHARSLFARQGFSDTRFDVIGADLGMTSGVMYHHFRNKRELFEEVVKECHSAIAEHVVERAETQEDIFTGILNGCIAFIEEVVSPKYFQIVLIDSISVLGWKRWKEIDSSSAESTLVEALREARQKNLISDGIPIEAMARAISGATNELALWVYHQPDKKKAMKQATTVLGSMIAQLRREP